MPVHERNRHLAQNIRKVIELNTVTKDPLFNVFVAKELAYANRLERTLDDPYGPEKL
ncbi:hypothetical protein [Vibrio phage BONAISHI]|nr:hypothetical protein [Vibrio phage BONAISHI]